MRKHTLKSRIQSLHSLTSHEASMYLEEARGDELQAAVALALDRNVLDGSDQEPDEAEIHHAFYLIRRALGQSAPSFDSMRVELRRRMAA